MSETRERVLRLVKLFGLTLTAQTRVEKDSTQSWWLRGCVEGDQPLVGTREAKTLPEALEAAEAWLLPGEEP